MKRAILSSLRGCYHRSLRLYPAAFRAEFGDEMEVVFAAALHEAAEKGPGTVAAFFLKETADFPANLTDAYRQESLYPGVIVMKREASWNVWPLWVALNLCAIPLAILAAMALVVLARPLIQFDGQAPLNVFQAILFGPVALAMPWMDISQAILYGSMLILVTAMLQWLLLRRYLENAAIWIPLTAVGWLAGIFLIYLIRPAVETSSIEWLHALASPLLGALVGLTQWLYLRQVIDHAGYWVLASTIGYGLLEVGPFISSPDFHFVILDILFAILVFLFVILTPFAITGLALFLLLRQGDIEITEIKKRKTENGKRLRLAALALLLMIPLFFAGCWVYATGQLTLAKARGIYVTPEEGMTQMLIRDVGEYPVERIEIITARESGSNPQVWYVRVWVYADQRPDGKPTPRGYSVWSHFLRVEDGWVHVPEGAFPEFIGWLMELYGLEGAQAMTSTAVR